MRQGCEVDLVFGIDFDVFAEPEIVQLFTDVTSHICIEWASRAGKRIRSEVLKLSAELVIPLSLLWVNFPRQDGPSITSGNRGRADEVGQAANAAGSSPLRRTPCGRD